MKVAQTKIEGEIYNHHPGVFQRFDSALCGQDLTGDGDLGWEAAQVVEGKISCPDCLDIIYEARKIDEIDLE